MAALVASLMREQKAAEDRAIFDAYQNGGRYKGKVVTDDVILDYIKGRRDGFTRDDPLWDEWNNRFIQYDFTIGEQKIGLRFKEGKVSAGAVAQFYRQQLKKIPKDSAFYREVAGRAAEWAKAAVGAARGRARARARGGAGGLRGRLNAEIQKGSQYLALERALTDYAKRIGLIDVNESLTDADATELQDMFNRGIFMDAAQTDRLTFAEFRTAAKGYYNSLNRQVELQIQLGNQGITARQRRDKHLYGTLLKLNAVDNRAGYELLRERWLGDIEDAKGDPYAIAEANKKYVAGLETIGRNATRSGDLNANDPEFISGIVHEINALTTGKVTGKTVAEQFGEDDDAKTTAEDFVRLTEELKLLDTGKAYYGQTEPGGPLGVVKWPEGTGGDPLGLDDSLQPSIRTINGVRRVVYLKGREVTASVIIDTETGDAVEFDPTNVAEIREGIRSGQYEVVTGRRVGYTFTDPVTGKRTYGVPDPITGRLVFTEENPFSSDIIGVGGEDTVFTPGVVLNRVGDTVPDPATVFRQPVSLATGGSPVLSDGSVSAKDLLTLLNQGQIEVSEDEIAAYRARLERDARNETGTMARDRWYDESSPLEVPSYGDSPSERTRDARDAARGPIPLPDVASLAPVLQTLFGQRDRTKDDLYIPPPPPKPKPPAAPSPVKPKPPKPPTPKPTPTPTFTGIPKPPTPKPTPNAGTNKPKPSPAPMPIFTGIPWSPNAPSGSGGGF